jgi:hypothetical protein
VEAGHDNSEDPCKVVMLRSEDAETPVFNPCDACPTFDLVLRLRELLRDSMLQPRQDLHHACTVIATDPSVSVERVSAAFFHGLSRYAKRRMVFFNTKSSGISSGERWIARLLQVVAADDMASARYLIESTIEPAGRRWMLFLARELAAHLMPPANDNQTPSVDTQANPKES